jgi:hypothetical protein
LVQLIDGDASKMDRNNLSHVVVFVKGIN